MNTEVTVEIFLKRLQISMSVLNVFIHLLTEMAGQDE